jgi:hypothetical protein
MAKQQEEIMVKTTIRLPKPLIIAAKHRAIDDGEDFQDVVMKALRHYLGKKGER